uniref:Putative tick transposon n=1 Tax=Rhipicephalus microplus TaxID=6941 RepID=A0A6G5A9P4_RHIMP
MIGFRCHLATQDAMLQIKHQIIDYPTRSTRAILGLDLKKAFDNAAHERILSRISSNMAERAYNYVRNFLTNRKARLSLGGLTSDLQELGCRGTPQGSVISPMLFNLIMIGLPKELNKIPGLYHSIYADDITIWVSDGSDGYIEQRLQEAIGTVERYLEGTGLACSPEKSELLLYRPAIRGRPRKSEENKTAI